MILDNAEHLVEATAQFAFRLLAEAPSLTILVTSRQSLNIAGERLFPLAAIETPDSDTLHDALLDSPAVALFLDRARNARPDFILTPKNAPAIVRICQALEGMPLGIELAAARVVMQTPTQIEESLKQGLMALKSHLLGLSPRHRSLRASIQGSFDLLTAEQKTFFLCLSIFQGGWTVEAARSISDCEETQELLAELSHRSLLVLVEEEAAGIMRGSFLETIRQFALEQLSETALQTLASRHADYFLSLASNVDTDDYRTLLPVESEIENLLFALETGCIRSENSFWKGLSGALTFSYIRGNRSISTKWARRTLELIPIVSNIEMRIRLGYACYNLISYSGDAVASRQIANVMRRDSTTFDYKPGEIQADLIECFILTTERNYSKAIALCNLCVQSARAEGDVKLIRRGLSLLGWICSYYDKVSPYFSEGDSKQLLVEGVAASIESLSLTPELSCSATYLQLNLVSLLTKLERLDEAYSWLKLAQQSALNHRIPSMMIFTLTHECKIAFQQGNLEYAALFLGSFLASREQTGYLAINESSDIDHDVLSLPTRLDKPHYDALLLAGGRIPIEEILSFSLQSPPDLSPNGRILSELGS